MHELRFYFRARRGERRVRDGSPFGAALARGARVGDVPAGLLGLPPTDRDESRFAQASKQMIETGDYVSIRFQDEARNQKPVGTFYWLQAATVRAGQALGVPDALTTIWLYRIPSLLGAVATCS